MMKKTSVICLFFVFSLMFVSCANFSPAENYLGNIYKKPTPLTKVNNNIETAAENISEAETGKMEIISAATETQEEDTPETEKIENDIQVEEEQSVGKYIITANGKKFHRDTCKTVKSVKQTVSYDEAVTLGYEPCKICNPANE